VAVDAAVTRDPS